MALDCMIVYILSIERCDQGCCLKKGREQDANERIVFTTNMESV